MGLERTCDNVINHESHLMTQVLRYEAGHPRRDIAIKYCKEHYNGDASQNNQQREAPHLVQRFLSEANYLPSYIPQITELVLHHHDYELPKSQLLQLLMEADLIVNCYESELRPEKAESIQQIFQTATGKELLELCLKNRA